MQTSAQLLVGARGGIAWALLFPVFQAQLQLTDWSFLVVDFHGCLFLIRGCPFCDRQLLVF